MRQTGTDYDTAKAALKTSDGDVAIAIRIIESYILKEKADADPDHAAGQSADDAANSGSNEDSHQADDSGSSDQSGDTAGSGSSQTGSSGSSSKGGQQNQYDSQIPLAKDIIDAIKEIWKRGNASRLDIEKDGRVVLSVSLTISTIGLILAPVAALIGIGAAMITEYTVKITLDNGTVINVNEFAVKRSKDI
jgi:hypothetical protein